MDMTELDRALVSLPHGPEFRFLDRITALDAGHSGTAEYRVPREAHFLKGHFPGQPIMPGVLMIEAVAQLAGAVAQCDPQIKALANLRLTAVRGAKIFGAAQPGEQLQIEARVAGRLGNLIQANGTVTVGSRILLETALVLSGDNDS